MSRYFKPRLITDVDDLDPMELLDENYQKGTILSHLQASYEMEDPSLEERDEDEEDEYEITGEVMEAQ